MDFELSSYPIECHVLGSLIINCNPNLHEIQAAFLQLTEDCFTKFATRELFRVIKKLYSEKNSFEAVDLLGIVQNDVYWLLTEILEANVVYTKNRILSDCETLCLYKTFRHQLTILNQAIVLSQKELTPKDALEKIHTELENLNLKQDALSAQMHEYEKIADDYLCEEFLDDSQIYIDIPRLPAVPNRSLLMIAGRSGHGKTFFAIYLMDKLIDALPGKQTLYFNLEMHERVMMERHARILGVTGEDRREIIKNSLPLLLPKSVSLISVPMITIEEIESYCRIAALKKPLGVVVVDYIGLIRTKNRGESNYLEQCNIAKRLAALSIELNCVVIGLTQVNREFKNRPVGNRCPVVSDSAESMGSVHSASWWIGIDQPQLDSEDSEFTHMFQVRCRKNRGEGGLFALDFDFNNCQFTPRQKRFSSYQSLSQSREMNF